MEDRNKRRVLKVRWERLNRSEYEERTKEKLEEMEGKEPGKELEWKDPTSVMVDAMEEVCGRERKEGDWTVSLSVDDRERDTHRD